MKLSEENVLMLTRFYENVLQAQADGNEISMGGEVSSFQRSGWQYHLFLDNFKQRAQ